MKRPLLPTAPIGWERRNAATGSCKRPYLWTLRCHNMASMEPAQFTSAVASIVNTSRIILQYVQNLAKRRQHKDDCEEDMDTDVPENTGCGNWDIMAAAGLVETVERRFWARQTSTDCHSWQRK
ncbi:hypothetical protein UY3_18943 [Chelonia mydas]|uniref:Uncharacterized protein n=1 Tax=Chelonia mydas TaxID=8469 RepID=M7AI45_CHEMY|nr:hypothetical protein UY3_18943 [Chelonia mydas]